MSTAPSHSAAFRRRRFLNWAPLGITYAFLYMGRYNLTVAKVALGDLMSLEQFGIIFGVGTTAYAFSFLVNGPLTDRLGGRMAILLAAAGSGIMNMVMGFATREYILSGSTESPTLLFSSLYAVNMYFQSFGAVAIVKVNSNWFHVGERGTFSAIFGAIISSGIFLAFDVGFRVVAATAGQGPGGVDATWWVFFVPSIALLCFFFIDLLLVRDTPGQAKLQDFDTGAARLADNEDAPLPTMVLLRKILTNPIILTVAAIEFCTGVLRNGIMHWYPLYAKSTLVLPGDHFMISNWGLILMIAGISGGAFAGIVSDKLFQSRRAPAAGGLYFGMIVAVGAMIFLLGGTKPEVGWLKGQIDAAKEMGLANGDLVVAIDQKPVDINRDLARIAAGGKFSLSVLRGKKTVTVDLDLTDSKARAQLAPRKHFVGVDDQDLGGGKKGKALRWDGMALASGDLIVGIDGKAIQNRARFIATVSEPGKYTLTTLRGKQLRTVVFEVPDKEKLKTLRLRKNVITLKDQDLGNGKKGVALHWKGQWAHESGFRKGDVIVSVNGATPDDWLDFSGKLDTQGGKNEVVVERDGKKLTLAPVYRPHAPQGAEQKAKFMKAGPVQTLNPFVLGGLAFFVSICVIGTHGLLSGTATMDFGGKRGTATAVGVIDGFVYLGTAVQSFSLGYITSRDWSWWPIFLLPFAVIGFYFCTRIWHAKPRSGGGGH